MVSTPLNTVYGNPAQYPIPSKLMCWTSNINGINLNTLNSKHQIMIYSFSTVPGGFQISQPSQVVFGPWSQHLRDIYSIPLAGFIMAGGGIMGIYPANTTIIQYPTRSLGYESSQFMGCSLGIIFYWDILSNIMIITYHHHGIIQWYPPIIIGYLVVPTTIGNISYYSISWSLAICNCESNILYS